MKASTSFHQVLPEQVSANVHVRAMPDRDLRTVFFGRNGCHCVSTGARGRPDDDVGSSLKFSRPHLSEKQNGFRFRIVNYADGERPLIQRTCECQRRSALHDLLRSHRATCCSERQQYSKHVSHDRSTLKVGCSTTSLFFVELWFVPLA